ncbi:hypothetical protein LT330_007292 [Penicillium expansum]|nr:hypothetical protein LT330_007292 [Penicillium expansum]
MAQTQSNAVYMFSKPTVPISSPSDSTPAPGSGEHHLISQELASWQKNKIQREPYHRVGYEWTAQRPQEQSNDYLDATCMVRLLNIPISATTASPWGMGTSNDPLATGNMAYKTASSWDLGHHLISQELENTILKYTP